MVIRSIEQVHPKPWATLDSDPSGSGYARSRLGVHLDRSREICWTPRESWPGRWTIPGVSLRRVTTPPDSSPGPTYTLPRRFPVLQLKSSGAVLASEEGGHIYL